MHVVADLQVSDMQIHGRASTHCILGKALVGPLSSTDTLIDRYQDTFKQLRENFMGRIATQTALVTFDIATTVNDISASLLSDTSQDNHR